MKYRSEDQRYVELGEGLAHKINAAFNKRPVRITKDAKGIAEALSAVGLKASERERL